jgi:hypothetical protein
VIVLPLQKLVKPLSGNGQQPEIQDDREQNLGDEEMDGKILRKTIRQADLCVVSFSTSIVEVGALRYRLTH